MYDAPTTAHVGFRMDIQGRFSSLSLCRMVHVDLRQEEMRQARVRNHLNLKCRHAKCVWMFSSSLVRRLTLFACWFLLGISIFITVLSIQSSLRAKVASWAQHENHIGQPFNPGLELIFAPVMVIVCAVKIYKLHTDSKFDPWGDRSRNYEWRSHGVKSHRLPPPQ